MNLVKSRLDRSPHVYKIYILVTFITQETTFTYLIAK